MPAPSLLKLARDSCIANIRHIYDVGDAPYHLVEPLLAKVENPKQLRAIEEASPQIAGADAELWRNMIKRDIPQWRRQNIEPKNPQNWWKVYRKLKKETDDEIQERAAALKAEMAQKEAEKRSNHMIYMDKAVDPRKKKPKASTARPAIPLSAARPIVGPAGSRSKRLTGAQFMEKMRKDARDAKVLSGKREAILSTSKQQPTAFSAPTASTIAHPTTSRRTRTIAISPKGSVKSPDKKDATQPTASKSTNQAAKEASSPKSTSATTTTGPSRDGVPKQINTMQHPSTAGTKTFEKRFLSKRPGEPSIFMPKKKRKV